MAMGLLAPTRPTAVALVVLLAAGSASAAPVLSGNEPLSAAAGSASFTRPALITFDIQNNTFVYWPITRFGGTQYQPLSGALDIYNARGMAAKGSVLIVTGYAPPKVVSYDVFKQRITASASDPYGEPYDIAVDQRGTIYALNDKSVAIYRVLYVHARMVVYPRPYEARTGVQHYLVDEHCAQRFRLDASSTHIFVADSNYLGFPYIDQNRYPSGNAEGTYTSGQYASGNFTGFTTIPNRLPN